MNILQIKINFNVTPGICRYVFAYLLSGEKSCWLIDSGVCGSHNRIIEEMSTAGMQLSDLKGIFLTHAHPDHIGTARWFQQHTGCRIFASAGEEPWISDIEKQYRDRPIPNFHNLAGSSVQVDTIVEDGALFELEDGHTIEAVSTPGHSADEMSYRVGDVLFIGDAVPVRGDIPIYVDKEASIASLKKIKSLPGIRTFYPAWDTAYSAQQMKQKIEDALELIQHIDSAVRQAGQKESVGETVRAVCEILDLPLLMKNPLFARTVMSHLQG